MRSRDIVPITATRLLITATRLLITYERTKALDTGPFSTSKQMSKARPLILSFIFTMGTRALSITSNAVAMPRWSISCQTAAAQ